MVGIVLGVSMTPTKVRMVLVEGECADGATVDQDNFDVDADRSPTAPSAAPNQVVSAILGTREGAHQGGYRLLSTGVTWTDHVEAALLRDALIAHKIENVMLVSAFMAAAALAQAVGDATNYARTALLFVEPYTATLAVVDTADGSISEVHRRALADDEDEAVAELVDMVSGAEALETRPEGVVVVGSGVDIPLIKPALEAATSLALSAPDEPEMALAHGAALASANAPLFASSTAALAYALDPGTGEVDPLALAGQVPGLLPAYQPEYRSVSQQSDSDVAYSAVPDEDADAHTVIGLEDTQRRKSVLLVGSTLAVIFISAVVALEIALAIGIRPTVALRPSPNENIIAPAQPPAPAPVPQAQPKIPAPAPVAAPHPIAPPAAAPVPAAPRPGHPIAPPAAAPVPAAPPAPVPVIPPPVFVPVPRVPFVGPPVRGPLAGPPIRGPFGGGPAPRGPFGGGRGPFGGHGLFGGGHGGFGGGHGFGGFGGGHGFGGFGHR
ncbi:DUF7159 family protein [Mycobacterium terramassiliense]|uniref:DUF7159 family protein n=1 Tax=Mycobacterium terramassiliense TaxID=1841859 RepID=UPI0009F8AF0F|nr:hypothetical protein [Mycobacterium terramassiliense]